MLTLFVIAGAMCVDKVSISKAASVVKVFDVR